MRLPLAIIVSLLPLTAQAETAVIPDNQITPGVSATTDEQDICGTVGGLTYSKRHRHTTQEMKQQAFANYGMSVPKGPARAQWEIDHRCELSLGCADDVRNLWPQPGTGMWNFHMKDKLEDLAHNMVCKEHKVSAAEAQKWFLAPADWRVKYCELIKINGKPDPVCQTLHHGD